MRSMHWHEGEGRLAEASAAVSRSLHDARRQLRDARHAGLQQARRRGGQAVDHAQETALRMRDVVAEHPLHSILLATAVGFAIGWIARRACTRAPDSKPGTGEA